ncbi:MAG: hypothetical protein Q7R80_03035, partial [bacterium]|nr:hypothetical protein [bacterium]
LTREELGIPDVNDIVGGLPGAYTLHRVLLDRLIRQRNIAVWQRTDPIVDDFLEQVRDLTTTDLTRSDLTDTDGNPVAFNETTWLPYLQALYPTLPRPTATPRYLDLSFVKWEQDPPATRIIHGVHGPRGGQVTIQEKSQLDAVSFRYPLITPSRHLALFSQYHAATGQCLDTSTWSWTFGMIDPQRFPDRPSVNLDWHSDELNLYLNVPGYANVDGRLRAVR